MTDRLAALDWLLLAAMCLGQPLGQTAMKGALLAFPLQRLLTGELPPDTVSATAFAGFLVYLAALAAGYVLVARHDLTRIYPPIVGATVLASHVVSEWRLGEGFRTADLVGGLLILGGIWLLRARTA